MLFPLSYPYICMCMYIVIQPPSGHGTDGQHLVSTHLMRNCDQAYQICVCGDFTTQYCDQTQSHWRILPVVHDRRALVQKHTRHGLISQTDKFILERFEFDSTVSRTIKIENSNTTYNESVLSVRLTTTAGRVNVQKLDEKLFQDHGRHQVSRDLRNRIQKQQKCSNQIYSPDVGQKALYSDFFADSNNGNLFYCTNNKQQCAFVCPFINGATKHPIQDDGKLCPSKWTFTSHGIFFWTGKQHILKLFVNENDNSIQCFRIEDHTRVPGYSIFEANEIDKSSQKILLTYQSIFAVARLNCVNPPSTKTNAHPFDDFSLRNLVQQQHAVYHG